MKQINTYIIEKLRIDKDIDVSKKSSKYEEIYNVHEEDKVLSLTLSKKIRGILYIKLDVVKISTINPDDTIIVKDILTNKDINLFIYKFGDHTLSTQPCPNTFALWRTSPDWSALMTKDKAVQLMNASLRSTKQKIFNGYHLDTRENKESYFNRLKKELESND